MALLGNIQDWTSPQRYPNCDLLSSSLNYVDVVQHFITLILYDSHSLAFNSLDSCIHAMLLLYIIKQVQVLSTSQSGSQLMTHREPWA